MSGPKSGDHDGVPLDTVALTREGWRTYEDVQVGDVTLGYNPETECNEWTRVEAADVSKEPQDLVEVGNSRWRATVTSTHRWWSERRTALPVAEMTECPECGATGGKRGPFASTRAVSNHRWKAHGVYAAAMAIGDVPEFVQTNGITTAHDLVLSARADTEGRDQITVDEAALLGWILGDGHVNHASRTVNVWIYQSKPHRVGDIDALLADVPHSRYERKRKPHYFTAVEWRLSSSYARSLLARSGIEESLTDLVLSLSPTQRKRFLDAVIAAEGSAVQSGDDGEVVRIPQIDGPIRDAFVLAAYLDGFRPSVRTKRQSKPNASPCSLITLARPRQHGSTVTVTPAGREPVWSVKTALGTWTIRQHDQVMLTGSSAVSR